jgi:hypothetical protein
LVRLACRGPAGSTIRFRAIGSGQLVTLEDATKYIQRLPEAEQQLEAWRNAVEALLLVVDRNGPTMMARIGVMRALNRDRPPPGPRPRRTRAKPYTIVR